MDDTARRALDRLADLLKASDRAVVLTGAGVSTESGLPDYRGPSGLWQNKGFAEVAALDMFRARPAEFWDFYRERLASLGRAAPNPGHYALAALERAGLIRALITQNVDGLHHRAGSENVHEVHGSLREVVCLDCRRRGKVQRYPADEVDARADAVGVPHCDCGGVLKPDVVLFGERLPEAMDYATAYAQEADLMLACGSSLEVYPVALLPEWVKTGGGQVVVVNRTETEADRRGLVDLRISASTGEALPYLAEVLGLELGVPA